MMASRSPNSSAAARTGPPRVVMAMVTQLAFFLVLAVVSSSSSTSPSTRSHFVSAFQPGPASSRRPSSKKQPNQSYRPSTVLEGATGGWGIGQSRDILPEEFAKRGDRKAFEGYKLTDRGEFMRQVRDAKDNMKNEEIDELLGVARMAGIQVKEQRLNKFEPEFLTEEEDDDDLDLSV